MPTADRYSRYREDQTTVWISKAAVALLDRERQSPGEGIAAVLDRVLNDYRKLRRASGVTTPPARPAKTPAGRSGATKGAGRTAAKGAAKTAMKRAASTGAAKSPARGAARSPAKAAAKGGAKRASGRAA